MATSTQIARQIVDQLMNNENKQAAKTLTALQQEHPEYPLLGFLTLAPLWAKAESSYDETVRGETLQKGLKLLSLSIAQAESKITEQPDNAEWKLSLGLLQAFKGLAYMRLSEYLDAYHFGRAGRDTLRTLINNNPNSEDAYFVLGFYEYHTGNVPFYLSWLTWLVDLSGDKSLGVQYIQRAINRAPILGPEAARLLLYQTETTLSNACPREELAHKMAMQYPNNELFPWMEKQMNQMCKHQTDQSTIQGETSVSKVQLQ